MVTASVLGDERRDQRLGGNSDVTASSLGAVKGGNEDETKD
jgi:hypothetical protein